MTSPIGEDLDSSPQTRRTQKTAPIGAGNEYGFTMIWGCLTGLEPATTWFHRPVLCQLS